MRFNPNASSTAAAVGSGRSSGSRRRFGRLPQETLQSNIGLVLDISAGGMRVLTRRVPSGSILVKIAGYTLPSPLKAEVAWSKRVGLFKHEVGLRFDDVTPELAQCLTSIAAVNRFRRVM